MQNHQYPLFIDIFINFYIFLIYRKEKFDKMNQTPAKSVINKMIRDQKENKDVLKLVSIDSEIDHYEYTIFGAMLDRSISRLMKGQIRYTTKLDELMKTQSDKFGDHEHNEESNLFKEIYNVMWNKRTQSSTAGNGGTFEVDGMKFADIWHHTHKWVTATRMMLKCTPKTPPEECALGCWSHQYKYMVKSKNDNDSLTPDSTLEQYYRAMGVEAAEQYAEKSINEKKKKSSDGSSAQYHGRCCINRHQHSVKSTRDEFQQDGMFNIGTGSSANLKHCGYHDPKCVMLLSKIGLGAYIWDTLNLSQRIEIKQEIEEEIKKQSKADNYDVYKQYIDPYLFDEVKSFRKIFDDFFQAIKKRHASDKEELDDEKTPNDDEEWKTFITVCIIF